MFGLFALIIASRFYENGVAIHKFSVTFAFWISTLALLARNDGQRKCTLLFHNDGGFCHFERSDPTGCKAQAAAKKSKEFKIRFVFGYFAIAQYDKIYDTKSVRYDKTNRYDNFRLSPKFFRTNEKFKEFAIFLKNFIRGVKTTLCVAGLCYNEIV